MSYSISVYPIEIFEKTKKLNLTFYEVCDFIEKKQNLVDFDAEQLEKIENHLNYRGYTVKKSKTEVKITNKKLKSVSVMLTKNGLFFNARGEEVFDISMTALEFNSDYELKRFFAVFDAQNDGWQD